MTDAELTAFAAKALGNAPLGFAPLTDDGDALRLAVKIGMEFAVDDEATHCAFAYARVRGAGDSHIFEPIVDDSCKALRRAIVRAAAEIGRML
ncbi:MAG: hypothetical protein J5J04_10760 [Anaerolineae bacterium]|nr:hypothetical protein [Anaerolineae bacterium]